MDMDSRHAHRDPAGRPSWLTSPCPSWCTRPHREHDHPEDRRHQADGVVIPAVLGRVDPGGLSLGAQPGEIVVQRVRDLPASAPTWWVVAESELARTPLVLSHESAARLRSALPETP